MSSIKDRANSSGEPLDRVTAKIAKRDEGGPAPSGSKRGNNDVGEGIYDYELTQGIQWRYLHQENLTRGVEKRGQSD